jgi:uncharacterized protein (TIGR03067 family)
MKLQLCLVSCLALLVAVSLRAADDAQKELDKVKGSWVIESMTAEGNDNPEAKGNTMTIDGNNWSLKIGEQDIGGTLKLDTSKKPHTVDFALSKGNDSGKTALGIYELKDNVLKVCVIHPGETDRPSDFKAEAGSKRILLVFKKK